MKTSQRFEQAINKLYTAFHNDTLHPECCKQCAVGNICNNTDSWRFLTDNHGSLKLNYVGIVNQNFGKKFFGYTPLELLQIEATFLKACGYSLPLHHTRKPDKIDKETLFKGLSAAVAYLCKLDGIKDIMDYSKLFEFKKDQTINNKLATLVE